jgi:hypothetical protein
MPGPERQSMMMMPFTCSCRKNNHVSSEGEEEDMEGVKGVGGFCFSKASAVNGVDAERPRDAGVGGDLMS